MTHDFNVILVWISETHSWKCKLPSAKEIVLKYMKPLNCEFAINSIPKRCSTWDATEDSVQNLLTAENVCHMDSYEGEPKEINVVANSGTVNLKLLSLC